LLSHTEGEIERSAFIQFRRYPHPASVFVKDALHRRQTDARAFKIFRTVQPLEHAEQFVGIFHVEADAIIPDPEH
jgi:hypothetical protein